MLYLSNAPLRGMCSSAVEKSGPIASEKEMAPLEALKSVPIQFMLSPFICIHSESLLLCKDHV